MEVCTQQLAGKSKARVGSIRSGKAEPREILRNTMTPMATLQIDLEVGRLSFDDLHVVGSVPTMAMDVNYSSL